ncbi:hypothetical protein AB6805_13500 [Chitinophaga sp. RCC_12]|uniref:hypothetical protein n=1 Tax=Chitinophaga sp. RCC_12 TaxID=3239226 RepID=UPI00352406EB
METKLKDNRMVERVVVVYPDLTTDPMNMQGKIGKVTSAYAEDVVTVGFIDGTTGYYKTDALATMLPKNKLLDLLHDDLDLLSANQQREILQIIKEIMKKNPMSALAKAMENEFTKSYCTVTLQAWQELKLGQQNAKQQRQGL